MKENNQHSNIPQQQEGSKSDTASTVNLNNINEAKIFYEIVKKRLLNVNSWHHWAGAVTANFQLTNDKGDEVQRPVQTGDHFKIDIPGPGIKTGDGYDWVRVESIDENKQTDQEETILCVRPATNPNNSRHDVAHFFNDEATSSFIVKREGSKVTASVHGRNEKPNTDAETVADKARNTLIALGAATAFSKLQWKSLVNGLLKKED